MKDSWKDVRRLLCVRLDSLGDVLMSTPAMRAFRETLGCHVTLLTSAAGAAAARLVPEVDEVIEFAAPWMKAAGNGAGNDRRGRGGERHLEDEVGVGAITAVRSDACGIRRIMRFVRQAAGISDSAEPKPLSFVISAGIHQAIADFQIEDGANGQVHQILKQDVDGVFGLVKTNLHHGEAGLHQHDEEGSDQDPDDVQRGLGLAELRREILELGLHERRLVGLGFDSLSKRWRARKIPARVGHRHNLPPPCQDRHPGTPASGGVRGAAHAGREIRSERAQPVQAFGELDVGQAGDQGAADDHGVGEGADLRGLVAVADPEPHTHRKARVRGR